MRNKNSMPTKLIAECKKQLVLRNENLTKLAEGTGLCYGHIRNVMSGQRCSKTTKQKICGYLGIDADEENVG